MSSPRAVRNHQHRHGSNNTSIRFTRETHRQDFDHQRRQGQGQEPSSSPEHQDRYNDTVERAASAHEYAQKLNNIAAMCIEIGKYDKAITSLGKALKLSEIHTTDQLLDRSEACTCCDCTIDGCINHTEQDSSNIVGDMFFDVVSSSSKNSKKRKFSNSSTSYCSLINDRNSSSNLEDDDSLLYRKPIRIPKRPIREGHNMGSTLFLIITFNLALAHHLKAMLKKTNATPSSSKLLSNTVQLYELVNHWQNPAHDDDESITNEDEDHYVSDDEEEHVDDSAHSTNENEDEEEDCVARSEIWTSNGNSKRFNRILYNNLTHFSRLMMKNVRSNASSSSGVAHYKQRLDDLMITIAPVLTDDDNDCDNSSSTTDTNTEPEQNHQELNVARASSSTTAAQSTAPYGMLTSEIQPLTRPTKAPSSPSPSQPNPNNKKFSRIVTEDDILEFEYYNKSEEYEYCNDHGLLGGVHQQQQRRVAQRRRSSCTSASAAASGKQNEKWDLLREDSIKSMQSQSSQRLIRLPSSRDIDTSRH